MASIKYAELVAKQTEFFSKFPYRMQFYTEFNYAVLRRILWQRRAGRGDNSTYNDILIMADTETSKKPDRDDNHVVAWTISLRAFGCNIATLYGRTPSQFCDCVSRLCSTMRGYYTIIYWHNMAYDWVFIRQFCFQAWGYPDKLLATKPHYPISITWEEGLIFKDSLILAQRSLDKWAKDLNVEHQKACGKWAYNMLRDQDTPLSQDELEYIEHDTLAGVECLDATRLMLNKHIYNIPLTATGIPREDVYQLARQNRGRELFKRMCLTYEQYRIAEKVYHGGFTHANRDEIGFIYSAEAYDFASSYPYCMLVEKYPMEKFTRLQDCMPEEILADMEVTAFMFKLILLKPDLKEGKTMPPLQFSKCTKTVNAICDNGRILTAEYAAIYITEQDLFLIKENYTWEAAYCVEVYGAHKDYLPNWFRDYVYKCYEDKCKMKGGDPVLYSVAKAKVNSLYG